MQPVSRDDQVVPRTERRHVWRFRLEVQPDAEVRAPLLQDLQQPPAAHRRERVAAAGQHLALVVHVDVVPAGEVLPHLGVDPLVGVLDAAERLVGEHHAEAERGVGGVPLPDGDLVRGTELSRERREVQAPRPAADDGNAHQPCRSAALFAACSRSTKCWTLPVELRGRIGTNSMARGYLYGAIFCLAKSCSSAASASPGFEPSRTTTKAVTSSPRSGSTTPTTAHSCTASCPSRASSTSGPAML